MKNYFNYFFNSKVEFDNWQIFKKNIEIKDVNTKSRSQNYFNYLNTYKGIDILDLEKYHKFL